MLIEFDEEIDPLYDDAAKLILKTGKASASLIQRHLRLGYARVARLLDQLEKTGVLGPADGAKPRKILIGVGDYKKPKLLPSKPEIMIPKLKWNKLRPKQIKNKILSEFLSVTKDFEILLGKDDKDEIVTLNMEEVGNLIITGSQFTHVKQLINQILVSVTAKWSENDLQLILIDGMKNELFYPENTGYLLTSVITDPEKSIAPLKWAISEIENRIKASIEDKSKEFAKILIVLHGFEEMYYCYPSEIIDNIVRLQKFGKRLGIYLIMTMDFVKFSNYREIIAVNPARIAFKPVDDRLKERNLAEVADLKSPNDAVLWIMYGENKKFEVSKLIPKKIYEMIFE